MKRSKIYTIIGIAILGFCISTNAIASDKEEKAVAAAQTWLALVDDEKYGASWETAAGYFKQTITKNTWEHMLAVVRKPLGRLISRSLATKTYMQSLPGAPDGEYVVIEFLVSFQNKKSGIETVTPMLDKDGKWRVAGYYIK